MSVTSSLWWLHSTNVCSSNISDITHGKGQPWYHGHFSLKQTSMKLNKMQTEYVTLQKEKHPNKKRCYLKYHPEIAHIHHTISVLLDSKWLNKSFWMFVLNCNDIIPEEARSCLAKTVIICSPKCKIITLNLLYNYFEMCPLYPLGSKPLFF